MAAAIFMTLRIAESRRSSSRELYLNNDYVALGSEACYVTLDYDDGEVVQFDLHENGRSVLQFQFIVGEALPPSAMFLVIS